MAVEEYVIDGLRFIVPAGSVSKPSNHTGDIRQGSDGTWTINKTYAELEALHARGILMKLRWEIHDDVHFLPFTRKYEKDGIGCFEFTEVTAQPTEDSVLLVYHRFTLDENNNLVYSTGTAGPSEGDIEAHIADKDNPHDVTAEQVGAYTKEQVDGFIRNWSGYKVIPYGEEKPAASEAELGKIYLVQVSTDPDVKDQYEEWISDGAAWSLIGTRSLDLDSYDKIEDALEREGTLKNLIDTVAHGTNMIPFEAGQDVFMAILDYFAKNPVPWAATFYSESKAITGTLTNIPPVLKSYNKESGFKVDCFCLYDIASQGSAENPDYQRSILLDYTNNNSDAAYIKFLGRIENNTHTRPAKPSNAYWEQALNTAMCDGVFNYNSNKVATVQTVTSKVDDLAKVIDERLDNYDTYSASIGGRTYRAEKIGNQLWISSNLDYQFEGLDMAPSGVPETPAAWYYANNEELYGLSGSRKCGLLYNWHAVSYLEEHASELLPPGWHVATHDEWTSLVALIGQNDAGTQIKSLDKSANGIWPVNWGGTDQHRIGVHPGGLRNPDGNFAEEGTNAYIWTATSTTESTAYHRILYKQSGNILTASYDKKYALSVRLVLTLNDDGTVPAGSGVTRAFATKEYVDSIVGSIETQLSSI